MRCATRRPSTHFFHYPDGNATVVRLLVRSLVPWRVAWRGCVVRRRRDGARGLREARRGEAAGASAAQQHRREGRRTRRAAWTITYVRGGRMRTGACPHLRDGLLEHRHPAPVPATCRGAARRPRVRESRSRSSTRACWCAGLEGLEESGHPQRVLPGAYWSSVRLDVPVNVGGFHCSTDPAQPIVVKLTRVPCDPGRARAGSTARGARSCSTRRSRRWSAPSGTR